jgi:predicted CXXCH cytochrome family protein
VKGGDQRPLCLTCHEEMRDGLKQKYVHAPAQSGECGRCHDPHGSAFKYQLAASATDSCLQCHEDVREELAAKFGHDPAAAACGICHDAHGSKHPRQTRMALNDLCLQCHYDGSTVPSDDARAPVELLPSARAMAAKGSRIHLDGRGTRGHPSVNHPVEGPKELADPKRPLTCVSCHNPHGAKSRQLFRFGVVGVSDLCLKCHLF